MTQTTSSIFLFFVGYTGSPQAHRNGTNRMRCQFIVRFLVALSLLDTTSSSLWHKNNAVVSRNRTIPIFGVPRDVQHSPSLVQPSDPSSLSLPVDQIRPPRILKAVIVVALTNIIINVIRPDPFVDPVMRLPRILWEICIANTAALAHNEPLFLLLLSLTTLLTAILDIFVWGPIFAFFVSWETCTGGGWLSARPRVCVPNYVIGSSRLLASIQSTLGGFFYLVVALFCWGQYWDQQEQRRILRQAAVMRQVMNQQHLPPQPPYEH